MLPSDTSYSIITGWYADHRKREYTTNGDEFVRSVECFDLWYYCINAFTNPEKIFVIDANSPVVPAFPADGRMNIIKLSRNHGHAAQGHNYLSGWSRALLSGLMCGLANGSAYTVLVEQGSLFYGREIIEREIRNCPDADIIAPQGAGTPQPLQTGIMIFRNEIVPYFIKRYFSLNSSDGILSPEKKCLLAARDMKLVFSPLPFGRCRPIDFDHSHFFFRHGSLNEIRAFTQKIGYGSDLLHSYLKRRHEGNINLTNVRA